MAQHIVSLAAEFSTTCCADGRWRCAEGEEDPELTFFGSLQGGRGINVEQALINALSERVSMTANQRRSDTHQLHPERLP